MLALVFLSAARTHGAPFLLLDVVGITQMCPMELIVGVARSILRCMLYFSDMAGSSTSSEGPLATKQAAASLDSDARLELCLLGVVHV